MLHFLERLLGLSHVRFHDGKLSISSLGQASQTFLPVNEKQFRSTPQKDPPHPVASLDLVPLNGDGRFIQGQMTMKMIPAWMALGEILATIFVLLAIISILFYAPFWILGGISRRRRRPPERPLRLWPLIAVLSLLAIVCIFALSMHDLLGRMGNPTVWSGTVWAMTLVFAVSSIASAFYSWQRPDQEVRSGVRRFSIIASLALLIATVYLAYWGIIGLRTWA